MSNQEKTVREPLFHISKRDDMPLKKGLIIRGASILLAFIVAAIFIIATSDSGRSFFEVFVSLFSGAFGSERRIWLLFQDTALLLGVSLALSVAFRMKFWNLGGNGQILMGCLATTICMHDLGPVLPAPVVILFMIVTSILAGAVWALIPAVFKAFFKTNESLFTLMMNYIAVLLVCYTISYWTPGGSGTLDPIEYANLPNLFGNRYILTILVGVLLTIGIFLYIRFSKHGYELSVVGESENTARYIGINVKVVVIRTLILSGALCGLIGLLLSGSINHTMNEEMAANMGFTGIMVAWLAKFDPLVMILTSFFITFLSRGMGQVRTDFNFTSNAITDIIIGIIYFFVIACEFFITYKINFSPTVTEFFKKLTKPFQKKNAEDKEVK